ncbi:hypothetical protein ACJ5H2_05940 [Nocardioides sp. R1-1]|uniref:hypothetical protein n=1 Tax=Nocardioides sp. R1-1 TaxID=3383502 RepID=UPI0038CF50D6
MRITITAGIAADAQRRTLVGTVYRYGEVGQTSAGPLGVGPSMPPPPIGLPVTLEHDRGIIRAHVAMVDNNGERLRVAVRVVDGPLGDAALAEASNRQRAAFSFDIEDAEIVDGLIVSGRWEAIGQVADPAFNSARIDRIAAASTTQEGTSMLTDEQRARLEELIAKDSLTPEEAEELNGILAILQTAVSVQQPAPEAAPAAAAATASTPTQAVAAAAPASVPPVPSGLPRPATRTSTRQGNALEEFCNTIHAAMQPGGGGAQAITAAFTDVTWSANSSTEAPAWSGELWSGLQYEPEFTPLLNSDTLTSWEGSGWRWVQKPQMADYAGDKAAVPSGPVSTEPGTYEAARMACGHDIDRKFYDFPGGAAFLKSYAEAAREDWAVKLDAKVEAYIIAQAVASGVDPGAGGFLTRLARLLRNVQRRRLGRSPFLILNDNDYDRLFDITNDDLPAFMDLVGLDPKRIVASDTVPADLAIAGAKQAATVRTLPGSPIRVDAQHLANGGVDSAFFGYWAIEEHHTSGILSMDLGYAA